MRMMPLVFGTVLCGSVFAFADEPAVKKNNPDYTEFTKLVHGFVVSQTPKQFEHRDGWGNTIPLPDTRLPLPNLRTYLKDGDKVVLPHGVWKRAKIRIDDPAKDLQIRVKDFKNIDGKTYRLALDADIAFGADVEIQLWQKGLMIGFGADTVGNLTIGVTCDVGVALNFKKVPPDVDVSPKVTELTLDLKDIRGRNGPIIGDEKLKNDVKGLIRGAVKSAEPQVKELVNQAIVQSIKDGKGTISGPALLKALPKQQ